MGVFFNNPFWFVGDFPVMFEWKGSFFPLRYGSIFPCQQTTDLAHFK